MHIWSALAGRECALFALLLLLGAGPASFLSERFDATSRIALAPILGFCVGTCVTTTLLEFEPADTTYWLLIPLALSSAALAAGRTLRARSTNRAAIHSQIRGVAALIVVCLAVAGPLSYSLHHHHTVGPAAYTYTDVDNYVAVQDAARTTSLRAARADLARHIRDAQPWADRAQWRWEGIVQSDQNLDATPLYANVNALLGLGASDTYAPFLIVMLLSGGLAAFAAVRYLTGFGTWSAALAGSMFGGAFFLELWFDSFQAAILALAIVTAVPIIGWELARARRRADVALLALLLATLLTVYPLWVPLVLAAGAILVMWRAVMLRRARQPLNVRPVLVTLAVCAVLTVLFDVVGFVRNVHYWQAILQNKVALPRVDFQLTPGVIPGWLTQTREFWLMPPLGAGGLKQFAIGALLPLVFLVLVVIGLKRDRRGLCLVVLAGVCAVAAYYAYASRDACTYCAERNLLPLAPAIAILTGLGAASVMTVRRRGLRMLGAVAILLVVAGVAQRARVELHRFTVGSYFVDSANRSMLAHLPRHPGPVLVEGYGTSILAQQEQPLVYQVVNERVPGHVSISLSANFANGIAFLIDQVQARPGPELRPYYRYVLTRLGGVQTDRQVIARSGGIALERRVKALDVFPYDGLATQLEWYDHSGLGWVLPNTPVRFFVTGDAGPGPVWARVTFARQAPVSVARGPGVRVRITPTQVVACVRATGAAPVRQAVIPVVTPLVSGPRLPNYARLGPSEGVALVAMHAVTGDCRV